jgi:hypothetical protein
MIASAGTGGRYERYDLKQNGPIFGFSDLYLGYSENTR